MNLFRKILIKLKIIKIDCRECKNHYSEPLFDENIKSGFNDSWTGSIIQMCKYRKKEVINHSRRCSRFNK